MGEIIVSSSKPGKPLGKITYRDLNWPLKERNIYLGRWREENNLQGWWAKQGRSGERVSRGIVGEVSMVFGTKYSEPIRPVQRIYMFQIL